MTRDDDPDTSEAFAQTLSDLVLAAAENGVPVEGGWAVKHPESAQEWSVEVTRVRDE